MELSPPEELPLNVTIIGDYWSLWCQTWDPVSDKFVTIVPATANINSAETQLQPFINMAPLLALYDHQLAIKETKMKRKDRS